MSSAIHLSTAAQPHLEQTKGCIINISSIAAKRPMPNLAPYCVAKAGMDMLTQCCALEWASKASCLMWLKTARLVPIQCGTVNHRQ